MKKFFSYVIMSLMALCFAMPTMGATEAEAAKVAVVPLQMNVKSDYDAGQCAMLYSDACVKYFQYPAFDLVDSELVRQAVANQTDLFSEAGMRAVADATGADIVLAMSVTRFDVEEKRQQREETMYVDQYGRIAVFNKITNKYKNDSWRNDNEMEIGFITRSDFPHDEFGRAVKRVIKSAVKA